MGTTITPRGRALDDLKACPSRLYEGINLNWLVLFSVGVVEERRVDLSFEHIVIAAFRLFPRKFSLLAYPGHPDAKRVHDALWRCTYKNRQWLSGKTSQGFAFTERGRQELELARQAIDRAYSPRRKTLSQTRRFEKLLAEVKSAPAYAKYLRGARDSVSEAECCHVLQGTLDSDRRVLVDNLTKLRDMAAGLQEKDVVGFMDWLGRRFARFLEMEEAYGKVRHTG
jgi:hypothetical protein